jgi:hypothetical protein
VEDFETAGDPWAAFWGVLEQHADWLAAFVRDRPVQTNEVQRCWVLLPIFLTVARLAGRPLDLVEFGASAGLNLLWDRYGYRYEAGSWGDASSPLQLRGEERSAVPVELLGTQVEVRRRVGIDLESGRRHDRRGPSTSRHVRARRRLPHTAQACAGPTACSGLF